MPIELLKHTADQNALGNPACFKIPFAVCLDWMSTIDREISIRLRAVPNLMVTPALSYFSCSRLVQGFVLVPWCNCSPVKKFEALPQISDNPQK